MQALAQFASASMDVEKDLCEPYTLYCHETRVVGL